MLATSHAFSKQTTSTDLAQLPWKWCRSSAHYYLLSKAVHFTYTPHINHC